jgi:hypothetical protein
MVDSQVIQNIGRKLQSIMPFEAQEITYFGKIYDDYNERMIMWRDHDGKPSWYSLGKEPVATLREIMSLAEAFRESPSFSKSRWTHFKISLCEKGKLNFKFEYIPRDDDWAGVFMQRVSDLTFEEAKAAYIPETDWHEFRRKRFESDNKPPTP